LRAAVAIDRSRASAWNALSVVQYGKLNVAESNLAARRAYEADAYLAAAPALLGRLFVTSYDLEQFVDAAHWCDEGRRRFPQRYGFTKCRIMLLGTKALKPDVEQAWEFVDSLKPLVAPADWEYERRDAAIYAAAVIGRAGLADSARRVLERARATGDVDPRGELLGREAAARVVIGDRDEAIALLQRYLAANPEHRAGFAKANAWWWRDLQNDPRFKALIASE
jgi:serine/threonine-protein kinase